MKVDFHVHTSVSDGRFAPESVLALALRASIRILAVTDHDAIEGFDRAALRLAESAPTKPLRLVAGVEFSTVFEKKEVHLLGYFPRGVPQALRDFLARAERARAARIEEGVRNLNRAGVPVTIEEVARQCPGRSIGRAHLARALVCSGRASSVMDAFRRFLSIERGLVPPSPNAAEEVARLIRDLGGIGVIAHPPIDGIERIARALVPHGLEGLEVYGKRRRGADPLYLEALAADLGLICTAGSDWHGTGKAPELEGVSVALERIAPFLKRLNGTPAAG
jgi:predicted metal-dependent phosphoesterase TrpH